MLPQGNECVNLQNFKILIKARFIKYGCFECVLMPSTDNIDFGPNTKKYQDHIFWNCGYKLICVNNWYNKPYKT